ncbi:MAG: PilN domain-containing protein [bacterium]|nr:PilN domain-containing protein [bacterium]
MIVDFLPERVTIQRAMRARLIRQGYLMMIMLAGLVGLGYFNEDRIAQAEAEVASLNVQSDNMSTQLDRKYEYERQLADLMIKHRIDTCLGSRINAMDILGELNAILPKSMSLTSFELDTRLTAVKLIPVIGGAPIAATKRRAAKAGKKMVNRLRLTITGVSPNNVDVANFIAKLSASQLFEEVDMGYAKNIEFREKKAKEFQVSCYVAR